MLEGCGPDSIKKQDSCWFRAPAGYMKFHILRRDQGDVNPWRFIMGAKRGNKRKRRLVCVADKDVGGCPGLFCCISISAELLTSGSAHRALRLKRGGTCGHSTKNCWDSHFPHILALVSRRPSATRRQRTRTSLIFVLLHIDGSFIDPQGNLDI